MSRRLGIGVVYGAGLVQGLALVTVPAAGDILTSSEFHGLSSREYGTLFLPMVAAAIVASLVAGPLARRLGRKPVLVAGLALNFVAMAVLAASQTVIGDHALAWSTLLTAMTALGFGFGSTLTVLNALAAGFFPERSTRALTALHALLGTGTALAPLLVAFVTQQGAWWTLPIGVAVAMAVLVIGASAATLEKETGTTSKSDATTLRSALGTLWPFAVAAIVYGAIETIYANWAIIFLREDAGASVRWAGYSLAGFWAMVTVGRVGATLLADRLGPGRIYLALPVLMLGAFLWISVVEGEQAGVLAFGLAGLACSAFLPMTIGFAERAHRDLAEVASGAIIAAYMLGFGIGSFGLGPLRESAGIPFSTLYRASGLLALVLGGVAWVLVQHGSGGATRRDSMEARD